MLCRRIIPCLDVMGGVTVKGVRFKDLVHAGDPAELAAKYSEYGADELVFLDISATREQRGVLARMVRRVAEQVRIPLTVGGGIRSEKDVELLLENGADKVSLNSAAVRDPGLITRLSRRFGSQCIVVAVDTKRSEGEDTVFISAGTQRTGKRTADWVLEARDRGAGEILLTSMDRDGTGTGFDIPITKKVSDSVNIPVIASGGGGSRESFLEVFSAGNADAALAAGIFHFNRETIAGLKDYLYREGIPVRRDNENG